MRPASKVSTLQVEAYLQPLGTKDCSYYAVAYIARTLGFTDVAAERVRDWAQTTGVHPDRFIGRELQQEQTTPRVAEKRWWLGPSAREWVTGWLEQGWVGLAIVHRIPTLAHATALVGADPAGVRLMDPWPSYGGFVTEPWEWFLGPGAGHSGCHRIAAWYRRAAS